MSYWTHIADIPPTPKRELNRAQAAEVEEVLSVAEAWSHGEIPTAEALQLVTLTPRVMGLAFQHCWRDDRRPALERLHKIEYGRRNSLTYTNFGWLPNHLYDQVQRHNQWRKQWADDRDVA